MNTLPLRLSALWFLCFFGATGLTQNQPFNKSGKQSVSLKEFTDHIGERVPNLMDDYDIPGVNIALVQKGKMVWVKAFGYADLENKRKMTTDTYCRVESISKSVTAWGVMKLAEQGDLELDTPIVHYLKTWSFPESNFQTSAITIRQLLSQTSGMPLGTIGVRYSPYENRPSLKEVLTRDAVLGREPGQSFSYSNTGFNLLELLIEEVTGRDFAEYMQLEILNPLGMEHSSFNWSESFEPPVPFGYDARNSPVPVYVYPDKAAGGLFSTVEDIATFISAGMTGFSSSGLNVLKAQNINQLYTPEAEIPGFYGIVFDSYGMGHFIEGLPNGEKAVSHGGQGSGWMTHFHSIPETGDGIVILTNSQRSWPFFAHILSDWARWNSFPSVGMGKIILGTKILWAFIGALFLWSLWQIWRLAKGLVSGTRNFSPMSKRHRGLWWGQIIVSIGIIAILVWSINQPYLFVSSVFPIAANWLGGSLLLVALVLMWSACFPIRNSSRHK